MRVAHVLLPRVLALDHFMYENAMGLISLCYNKLFLFSAKNKKSVGSMIVSLKFWSLSLCHLISLPDSSLI